jgi:hypothetical protein
MGMKSAFVLSILIASCGGLVQAQEMLSLQEWARRPVDQQEVSYAFVRCAGHYEGTTNYIGTAKLGPSVAKQQSDNAVALSLAALKIRSKTRGGKPDDYVEQVLGERRRIASVYEERMKINYASSGQAITDDPLMKGDLMFCKEVTEAISR